MNVRLVVPRLADGGERDRLWGYCRTFWREKLPDFEIVEGHHKGDGPFNRSAAINRAAKGDWDVLVIVDADTVIDAERVLDAVKRADDSGEMMLPYTTRNVLTEAGTRQILDGFEGNWERWVKVRERNRVSCCVVVPRRLWDRVGGFDERFEGWGGEDEAFEAACRIMGGVQRLQGANWHLWHSPSPHHDTSTPLYRQALRLCQRYTAADRGAMERLLVESRAPESIALVALTTGKRDTLASTLASAEENLNGPIGRRLVCVDGDPLTARRVASAHLGWDVERIKGGGYPRAVAAAMEKAIGSGQSWIFWLEDDFTFNGPVDLTTMQKLIERHDLAQLSLMRQPWYEHEMEAGGVVAARPTEFTQRDGYIEHRAYWTTNPMLTRRQTLAEHRWPMGRNSELRFGQSVFADPRVCAGILGAINDPERVHHVGAERAGSGY